MQGGREQLCSAGAVQPRPDTGQSGKCLVWDSTWGKEWVEYGYPLATQAVC